MGVLFGVSGSARNVSEIYIGVDGVARKVKSVYVGVDGVAELVFGGEYRPEVNQVIASCVYGGNSLSDVVYPNGRYKVEIAGYPATDGASSSNNCFVYEASVTKPFRIVAYCGDTASIDELGLVYKRNESGGIFGGGAGTDAQVAVSGQEPFGNSLSAYGAVCHFVPVGGTFGTDYLWCFHCAPSPKGGAYGGGAGGRGARGIQYGPVGTTLLLVNKSGTKGGDGEGGVGGAAGYGTISGASGEGLNGKPGSSGSGVGAGTATSGGVAVYNGSTWFEPTRTTNTTGKSYVKVTYLGTL